MGNIIELCAQELYPDPKIFLGFTMCLTRNYKDIPQRSLIEDCALEHAINFANLNECATRDDGGYGVGLLRDSIRRSTEVSIRQSPLPNLSLGYLYLMRWAQAGVTKSCTVRLNEEFYCVRDDKEWKDCPAGPGVDALVSAVERLYRAS